VGLVGWAFGSRTCRFTAPATYYLALSIIVVTCEPTIVMMMMMMMMPPPLRQRSYP
jgi:hypothetical protein